MKPMPRLFATTSLAIGLGATALSPAWADVTPEEVWNNWKSMGETAGQTVTAGNETRTGDTLALSDVAITLDLEDGSVSGTVPAITMTAQDDGTVLVTMSDAYDIALEMRPEGDKPVDLTVRVAMPDASTIASGDADAVRYDFSGPALSMSVQDVMVDDKPVELTAEVAFADIAGFYTFTGGEDGSFGSRIAADEMAVAVDGEGLEKPGSGLSVTADYRDVTATSSGSTRGLAAAGNPAQAPADGVRFDSGYSHGGGDLTVEVRDPESGTLNWVSQSDSGTLDAAINDGAMDYSGSSRALSMVLSGDALPVPQLEAAMDELAFGFRGPVTRTEEPEDFGLLVRLGGLTVSDVLWAMLDPANVLPRDPATLVIDLAGKARLLTDLGDQAAARASQEPGELHALDLRTLRLSVAGAELTGTGSFTFDNDDTTTFQGFPAPDGAVDLTLTGSSALLDKLVQMGLVGQDQAMGARMMLGLFSVQSGDDALSSKIEVRPDGSVAANGQRIR